jgi:hypothetical protein
MNWSLLFSKHVNASDEGVRFRHMKVRFLLLLSSLLAVLTPTDYSR